MNGAAKDRIVGEPSDEKPSTKNEGGEDDRPGERLEDKTKRDQAAGDVADDLADFA